MTENMETSVAPIDYPPAAAIPARDASRGSDARQTLHRLASELSRTHNRKLLVEFLQLRRALR